MSAQSVTATSSEGEGDRRSHLQQSVIQFMIMVMVAMVIDDGCGGTADAGIILSVIIHMYKNKNTPNEPGDDNAILLRVLHDYNGNLEKDTTMLIPTYVNTPD